MSRETAKNWAIMATVTTTGGGGGIDEACGQVASTAVGPALFHRALGADTGNQPSPEGPLAQ